MTGSAKTRNFGKSVKAGTTVKILTVVKFAEFFNFSLIIKYSNCSITMPNSKLKKFVSHQVHY